MVDMRVSFRVAVNDASVSRVSDQLLIDHEWTSSIVDLRHSCNLPLVLLRIWCTLPALSTKHQNIRRKQRRFVSLLFS